MPQLFEKDGSGRRLLKGPPMPVTRTTTPHGQRVDPAGAPPGKGPTPDAKIRQRVLNRNADDRREIREGGVARESRIVGPPGSLGQTRQTPLGTPPEITAPPRRQSQNAAELRSLTGGAPSTVAPAGIPGQTAKSISGPPTSDRQVPGKPELGAVPPDGSVRQETPFNAAATQPAAPGVPQAVAPPTTPPGQQRADAAMQGARQAIAAGQQPPPPVSMDAQGGIRPVPGLSEQQALKDVDAQQTTLANQAKPEPPLAKSPLGRESPIEQADASGKLRSGQKHHLRALGLSQSGMDPKQARHFEKQAVRDMDLFGEYAGMDDPHAPPPPIRVGKHSFNPATGKFVAPEGFVSVLDRIAPIPGPTGPPR